MKGEKDAITASTVALTQTEKKAIHKYVETFARYVGRDEFRKDQGGRLHRVSYFQDELARVVDSISEAEIEKLVMMLWASQMWGNKQCLVQKIISAR